LSSNDNLDIGSQTFNFRNLTSISDYQEALREVEQGKRAVDLAGGVDSRLFKAPYGSTDDNIFSYLSRSGILVDFSYDDHYNKYQDGLFVRFESKSYHGIDHQPEFFYNLDSIKAPVIIEFDSNTDVDIIDDFISELRAAKGYGYDIGFVNASDLSRLELTIRKQASGGFS
jgi:peptidoglycan/xylan/chitin deacetylase (PgdA/CDA1 family)